MSETFIEVEIRGVLESIGSEDILFLEEDLVTMERGGTGFCPVFLGLTIFKNLKFKHYNNSIPPQWSRLYVCAQGGTQTQRCYE